MNSIDEFDTPLLGLGDDFHSGYRINIKKVDKNFNYLKEFIDFLCDSYGEGFPMKNYDDCWVKDNTWALFENTYNISVILNTLNKVKEFKTRFNNIKLPKKINTSEMLSDQLSRIMDKWWYEKKDWKCINKIKENIRLSCKIPINNIKVMSINELSDTMMVSYRQKNFIIQI